LTLAALPANATKAATLRHNATGRFRRAVHWATQLLSQCQALYDAGRLGEEHILEMTAFMLILNGRFLRYRDEFEDALIQLSVARGILDELAEGAQTSRDQALATYFADEMGPEIRYCAHALGHGKAYDVDNIVREQSSQHCSQIVDGYDTLVQKLRNRAGADSKGDERKLRTLVWEGEAVPVRNPELVDVLVKVEEGEIKLREESTEASKLPRTEQDKKRRKPAKGGKSKRGVAAYDNILLALSDAEDVARKLVEAQNASGLTSESSAPGVRDIHFVHVFIVYHLLARRIQRDLLLITTILAQSAQTTRSSFGNKAAPSKSQREPVDTRLYPAVVKLFDTTLQSLNQMRTLSIVDESADLSAAVDSRVSFTNARRCRYLALTYVPVKKYAEALTLLQRSNIHLREARSMLSMVHTDPISNGDPAFYAIAADDLDRLDKELAEDNNRFKNDWFTYNGGSLSVENKDYKKPLFFDIALNYVQLDMNRLQERAGKQAQPAVLAPTPIRAEDPTADKRPVAKAKAEEIQRPATPEPSAQTGVGLSSLLGGWWGRR
jgi:signal recognition particle subunit SRP68